MTASLNEAEAALAALLQRRGTVVSPPLRNAGVASPLHDCGISLDFSRQRLDADALQMLKRLANGRDVLGAHRAMVRGDRVNVSEGRPALHTALRAPVGSALAGPVLLALPG